MRYMIVEPGSPKDWYGPHTPLIAVAEGEPEPEFGPPEIGVEVDSFGEPTGRYADGTRGITDEDKAYAQVDDSPMCVCCHAPAERWADA